MDHAITVGMVAETAVVILVVVAVIGGLVWLLSAYASGFDH